MQLFLCSGFCAAVRVKVFGVPGFVLRFRCNSFFTAVFVKPRRYLCEALSCSGLCLGVCLCVDVCLCVGWCLCVCMCVCVCVCVCVCMCV